MKILANLPNPTFAGGANQRGAASFVKHLTTLADIFALFKDLTLH
jgi:hypothetical protein